MHSGGQSNPLTPTQNSADCSKNTAFCQSDTAGDAGLSKKRANINNMFSVQSWIFYRNAISLPDSP